MDHEKDINKLLGYTIFIILISSIDSTASKKAARSSGSHVCVLSLVTDKKTEFLGGKNGEDKL